MRLLDSYAGGRGDRCSVPLGSVAVDVLECVADVHRGVIRVAWSVGACAFFETLKEELERMFYTVEINLLAHRVRHLNIQFAHNHRADVGGCGIGGRVKRLCSAS